MLRFVRVAVVVAVLLALALFLAIVQVQAAAPPPASDPFRSPAEARHGAVRGDLPSFHCGTLAAAGVDAGRPGVGAAPWCPPAPAAPTPLVFTPFILNNQEGGLR